MYEITVNNTVNNFFFVLQIHRPEDGQAHGEEVSTIVDALSDDELFLRRNHRRVHNELDVPRRGQFPHAQRCRSVNRSLPIS